jgi:hypothetical protein
LEGLKNKMKINTKSLNNYTIKIFFGKYLLIVDFSMKLKILKYINILWAKEIMVDWFETLWEKGPGGLK